MCDPKRRDIYVAEVRDRVVHQLLSEYLNDIYETRFYFHSYASRQNKGVIRAVKYFLSNYQRLNRAGDVWAVKLDVRKYFSNINHDILMALLSRQINNHLIFGLIKKVIGSFGGDEGRGLPLGNLTSQVLANIYLHEMDFYIKNNLKIKYYLRYNDDLIFLCQKRDVALAQMKAIINFASEKLALEIPEEKTAIIKPPQTIDILGCQTNSSECWTRPQTVRRAQIKLRQKYFSVDDRFWDSICSYSGICDDIITLFDW